MRAELQVLMYNRGVDQLLAYLPQIEGIDGDTVKRLLTSAWVDALEVRDQDNPSPDSFEAPLRRLATALELHAVLPNQIELEMLRACAFVAAEALSVAAEVQPIADGLAQTWLFGDTARYEQIETGLLYLIAGYDANAALCVRELLDNEVTNEPTASGAAERWTLRAVLALISGARADDSVEPEPTGNAAVSLAARHEVLLRIGRAVRSHLRWLRMDEPENISLADLTAIAADLSLGFDGEPAAVIHPDLYHLVLLLIAACGETTRRALRDVPPPPADDAGVFSAYQRSRAVERPLLWPAAQQYADSALPGPDSHAVVAVPTGAGKSAVAELAIAQAMTDGWVLYLAPTNALVGQIRRQLQQALQQLPDVTVDQFVGGSEYTVYSEEGIEEIPDGHILVMTPEKCSLALRVNPEAFQRLVLCVVDEAHGIGETGTRAAVLELVIAEVLHRAPAVKVLLMSALIANPQDLASWLENVTGFAAHAVIAPWRPTRTLRALAGFDQDDLQTSGDTAKRELDQLPPHRRNVVFSSKLGLLTGLQGAWSSGQPEDYKYVVINVRGTAKATRRQGQVVLTADGYLNPAVRNLVQALGDNGHRVMAFLPRSKHDSFTVARDMAGFGAVELSQDITAYLDLANAELGVASAVRGLLGKGIAVHTSAMLREEQRASEAAFEQEQVRAMFATGTLAQGLNLPATAVVIGGTQIGYDPLSTRREDAARSRAQLLNAIGRAGRAQVATRSIAIVMPNNAQIISAEEAVSGTVTAAEFLREEDASTEVASQLSALIEATVRDDVELGAMTAAEEAAFAFLSFEGGDDASDVIAKSWAAYRSRAIVSPDDIAASLGRLGHAYLDSAGAPHWVAAAAHRAGLTIPRTALITATLRELLEDRPAPPQTVHEWLQTLLDVLAQRETSELSQLLIQKPFESTLLHKVFAPATAVSGWEAFTSSVTTWLEGQSLIAIAGQALPAISPSSIEKRGATDPIPRMIRMTNDGFAHELSMLSGAMAAVCVVGADEEAGGPWPADAASVSALGQLPVALRAGLDTPASLAWYRQGFRPRVVAKLLERVLPAPAEFSGAGLTSWIRQRSRDLAAGVDPFGATHEEVELIHAAVVARNSS